ncbi:MAG: hypothetical protein M3R25_05975 [Bacteroidota bacterium]|nr:hypothetical protein [Bacteroidota bacterium]
MIKYSIPFLFAATVVILGLSSPFQAFDGPRRDPVPPSQKVAHSIHCSGCHGFDETGLSLVDKAGHDVSIYEDWHISMMGLSSHDPFWRATLAHEVNLFPSKQDVIETTCLKCHAPLGSAQAHFSGLPYSYEIMLGDSLGLDGVSCGACHQQPAEGLGSMHSGNIQLDTNRVMFGPYPNPFRGPMQIYVGFEPVFSDHIYTSELCAGCHTLITETLAEDGTPTGEHFIEQATYHEWLNSIYALQGKECQSCHLPFIQDSVVIATDFLSLKKRYPYGLHQFFGANTAMLSLMKEHRTTLGITPESADTAWNESIQNNRLSLRRAGHVEITSLMVEDDTLILDLAIRNKTGHKLPSGYPSRVTWLQVVLTDPFNTDTIYANGLLNNEGHIEGRDFPYEPHHQISLNEQDVQIYEMVMEDTEGNLTTRLNAAAKPIKDNRLLPVGFRKNHVVYDTTAIWGEALLDPQYNAESQQGLDRIQYRIALHGRKGFGDLEIALLYHTFPARWMDDLFEHDSISQVAEFKSMYAGYEIFDEVIDTVSIKDILLAPSANKDLVFSDDIYLYPNPVNGYELNLISTGLQFSEINYIITDVSGREMQRGIANERIRLDQKNKPGLYYISFRNKTRFISIMPFTIL